MLESAEPAENPGDARRIGLEVEKQKSPISLNALKIALGGNGFKTKKTPPG